MRNLNPTPAASCALVLSTALLLGATWQAPTTVSENGDAESRVHLLTDGTVLFGERTRIDGSRRPRYQIDAHNGSLPKVITADRLVRSFPTHLDAVRYREARIPQGDLDARLELACWCLELENQAPLLERPGLTEARMGILRQMLAIDPQHLRASDMLASAESRANRQVRDPNVQQAGGGRVAHEPSRGRSTGLGPEALAELFDQPPGLAYERFQEYRNWIHPLVIQQACVRCHGRNYEGRFQLISNPPRSKRSIDPEVLRFNLERTLDLIDNQHPGQSELLVRAIMPHGQANRAALNGTEDRRYLALLEWVNRVTGHAQTESTTGSTIANSPAVEDPNGRPPRPFVPPAVVNPDSTGTTFAGSRAPTNAQALPTAPSSRAAARPTSDPTSPNNPNAQPPQLPVGPRYRIPGVSEDIRDIQVYRGSDDPEKDTKPEPPAPKAKTPSTSKPLDTETLTEFLRQIRRQQQQRRPQT